MSTSEQERDETLLELRRAIDAELDTFIDGCAREDVDACTCFSA